jgi:hypothetical protein
VRAALAVFARLGDERYVPCSVALHRGPAVTTRIDHRMAYYGRTLVRALELAASAEPRSLRVSSAALAEDAAQIRAISGVNAALKPAPELGPAAWCVQLSRAAGASVPGRDASAAEPSFSEPSSGDAAPTLRGSDAPAAR